MVQNEKKKLSIQGSKKKLFTKICTGHTRLSRVHVFICSLSYYCLVGCEIFVRVPIAPPPSRPVINNDRSHIVHAYYYWYTEWNGEFFSSDDAMRQAGNPTNKTSMEMENHVFQKAKTRVIHLLKFHEDLFDMTN